MDYVDYHPRITKNELYWIPKDAIKGNVDQFVTENVGISPYISLDDGYALIWCWESYAGSELFPVKVIFPHELKFSKLMAAAAVAIWDSQLD